MSDGWTWFLCKYELLVNMNYGWIWIMGKYESWVNKKFVKILIMGEYEIWANMNYGWIWIIGKYELLVDMNHGWIWIMGEYDLWDNFGVVQTDTEKCPGSFCDNKRVNPLTKRHASFRSIVNPLLLIHVFHQGTAFS